MNLHFKEIITITMILFAVIDVIGSLPVLLDLQARIDGMESRKASLKNTYRLEHLLGPGGINILRKIFEVILLAIAVKLFRTHAGI